jgi:TPR repeat protein
MKYSNVMKLVVLEFALALTACGGGSHRASHPSHPPLAPLDQARAYENGAGVARDYAEAAKIYKQQCASGSGPIVACRKLTKALLAGRGADRDMEGAFSLARTLCDTRNDAHSCVLVVFSMMRAGEEEEDSSPSEKLVSTLKAYLALRCDKRHLERCELPRDPFNWLDHSSSGERADHEFDDQGCKLGVLEACERFRFDPGARAFATVLAACRKGDADACVAAGQPIDAAILCKANDYGACAALGCAGNTAAAQIAADHGAPADCGRSHTPTVATGITPSNVPMFDSIAFTLIKTAKNAPLRYQVTNRGTKSVEVFIGAIYGYDAAGTQVDRRHFEFREGLEPGHATTLEVGFVNGVSFDPCIEVIAFDPYQSYIARCPTKKARGARWGNGNAAVELKISFDDLPLADDWIGTLEPTLAEPFEQTHAGIRVRAVSGDGAVMLPSAAWDLQQLASRTIQIPFVRQPTVIAYRVSGVDDLKLSAPTLAKIFAGKITKWNDPAIAKDNPNTKLPSFSIVVFQTANQDDQLRLTTYLTKEARAVWKLGATKQGAFHKNTTFVRSYDLAREVASREGAIVFIGPGLAEKAGLKVAQIKNARGAFVAPTSEGLTRGDYPIVSTRALYVRVDHPDQATADAARSFATWLVTDALPIFERMGFGRESDAAIQAGLKKLSTLTVTPPPN